MHPIESRDHKITKVRPSFQGEPYTFSLTDKRTGADYYFDSVEVRHQGLIGGLGGVQLLDHNGDVIVNLQTDDLHQVILEALEHIEEFGEIPQPGDVEYSNDLEMAEGITSGL